MPKRNSDEKQIERHWMILNKMTRRYGVTKQQLIKECGASERTIERDLPILRRYFPSIIEQQEGREKRYRFSDDYQFPALDLTPPERLALTLAQDATSFLDGTPYFTALTQAINKIRNTLPSEGQDYLNRLREILGFQLQPVKNFQRVAGWIQHAQDACEKQLCMDLVYRSASRGEVSQRKVDPYGIVYSENALRLVAYCHNREALREFVFDERMISLSILDETFERQSDFNLSEYSTSGFGGMRDQPVKAVIQVHPPASRWVREQKWSGLQKLRALDHDVIEMHFDTDGREGLMRQVLQWGRCAEVVSPPEFREEVQGEIETMRRRYD